MKANELRIGNLVRTIFKKYKITVSLTSEEKIIDADGDDYWPCEIEPIPLTEEWLLKFGFVNNKHLDENIFSHTIHSIAYDLEDCTIKISDSWEFRYNTKHVHQLQNLYFALTNEELAIK